MSIASLPFNQIAFAVIDLRRTEAWWREGLGFLPAGGNRLMFRPPLSDGAVQKLPKGAAMTCWCMVGRNDWAQLEMFQYEKPNSKLMADDYLPNNIGYSRCGIWVEDFDAALAQLELIGTRPLTPPIGKDGQRRVCVRNPDGVFVELMEDDPLPDKSGVGRLDCPVAIRSATMSTPDMQKSVDFVTKGLGMYELPEQLHNDEHEALWGLAGARCERKVFIGGTDNETLLLEIVQYQKPLGKPLPEDYLLCDQGILNICFGDPQSGKGVYAQLEQAQGQGAVATTPKVLDMKLVGCVYVDDPLGFSYEFMWASPGWAHKAFGFVPTRMDERPELDNQRVECSIKIAASPERLFAELGDHAGLSEWSGLGQVTLDKPGLKEPNGRFAERVVKSPVGTIREQITEWIPGQGYRYRILEGSPFVGYWGHVQLTAEGDLTRVDWIVRYRSKIPGLGGVLHKVVEGKFNAALQALKERVE
jgi:catechol 2,3-dioxygenase-like lactoylglutathione lyase family enzyme